MKACGCGMPLRDQESEDRHSEVCLYSKDPYGPFVVLCTILLVTSFIIICIGIGGILWG